MASGTIKWFNEPKGYGFLAPDAGGRDVFAHRSAIVGGGYNSLSEGAKIDFEHVGCAKGAEAKSVQLVAYRRGHPSEGTNAPLTAEERREMENRHRSRTRADRCTRAGHKDDR